MNENILVDVILGQDGDMNRTMHVIIDNQRYEVTDADAYREILRHIKEKL
jgi:hypothetical protein